MEPGAARGVLASAACKICGYTLANEAHRLYGCPAYDAFRATYEGEGFARHLEWARCHSHLPLFTRGLLEDAGAAGRHQGRH